MENYVVLDGSNHYGEPNMKYTAVVRVGYGAWRHRVWANTQREVKRNLARASGLPVRLIDPLPLGRSCMDCLTGELKIEFKIEPTKAYFG